MDGTDAVRNYAHDKIAKLQRFLRHALRADVTLSVEGNKHVADVRLKSGATLLNGSERSDDMYASIDLVVDKLERQIRTVKGTSASRKRGGMTAGEFAQQGERSRG